MGLNLGWLQVAEERGLVRVGAGARTPAPPRPGCSEDEFGRHLIAYAQARGWRVAHFRPGRTASGWRTPCSADAKGWPDLILVRGPRIVAAELKRDGGKKPTPEQTTWLAALRAAGVPAFVWKPKDWQSVMVVLEGGGR